MMMKRGLMIVAVLAFFTKLTMGGSVLSPWEYRGDMLVARHELSGAAVGGYVYALGGCVTCSPADTRKFVERYDPGNDVWEQMASMPTPRHSFGCAVLDGYIYAIGGHVANSRSENERYDPYTNTWESLAPMPTARSDLGVASFGGKIYVFGGNRYGTIQSVVEEYDPQTDTWRSVGNMPTTGQPDRAVTMGNKIYLAGGSSEGQITDNLWSYDPVTGVWETNLPKMNFARAAHELVVIGDRLFAIGGTKGTGALASVEWWTPGAASWTLTEPLNVARASHGGAAVGDTIYVFGGYGDPELSSMEAASLVPQGVIVFSSGEGGNGTKDLWAINADGTGLTQLTNTSDCWEYFPRWTPDSSKILFDIDTGGQIWSFDWASKTSTKIYDAHDYNGSDRGSFNVAVPSLSPDGGTIVFLESFSYNNPHIMRIGVDGQGLEEVPVQSGYVGLPSWSPDGNAIVYIRRNSGLSYSADLWIYDFFTGENRRLTQGAGSESTTKECPDWQPSNRIAFTYGHNVALIAPGESGNWGDPASPDIEFLTNDASFSAVRYKFPSWSPDLSQLCFVKEQGPAKGLYKINSDGTGLQLLHPGNIHSCDWGNPSLNTPPVAVALANGKEGDVTVEQESFGGTTVTLDATGSYDSDDDQLTYEWDFESDGTTDSTEPVASVTYNLGEHTATLTVTDPTGASDTDTVTVTVRDTTPPELTCPGDIRVEQATLAGTKVDWSCTATDMCDADVDIVCDPPSGTVFPLGTTTVTCTATDDSGNQTTDTHTVTVVDTTSPDVTCAFVPVDEHDGGDDEDEDDDDRGIFRISYGATDICDTDPIILGIILMPSLDGMKIKQKVKSKVKVVFDLKKDEVKIEGPDPQALLNQIQQHGGLLVDSGQLTKIKLKKAKYHKHEFSFNEKGELKIKASAVVLEVIAEDASGNRAVVQCSPPISSHDDEDDD